MNKSEHLYKIDEYISKIEKENVRLLDQVSLSGEQMKLMQDRIVSLVATNERLSMLLNDAPEQLSTL